MKSRRLLAALMLAACSSPPAPVSSSPRDPSNPDAPEGTNPMLLTTASAASSSRATSETWVCPMHPEVTSSRAGSCPKCNMSLVPKK